MKAREEVDEACNDLQHIVPGTENPDQKILLKSCNIPQKDRNGKY